MSLVGDAFTERIGRLFALARSVFADQTSPESYSSPKETIANSIGMKLVLIPKGTCNMGSPIEEKGRNEDEQRHQVTISKDYFIGEMEVTQGQYERMMGENWSFFGVRG